MEAVVENHALLAAGIGRRWGTQPVLTGANLALAPSSLTFLGGRNGAGKTTLLRILAGLVAPDSGRIRLAGRFDPQLHRREYQRNIGYLPAGNGGLYARLTVRANLEFWAGMAMLGPARRRDAVGEAINGFRLERLIEQRVDRMSMGQRQRVRLATTFLHRPRVVLLDEPQTSLDEESLELLDTALTDLRASGGAAVWCAPSSAGTRIAWDAVLRVEGGEVVSA